MRTLTPKLSQISNDWCLIDASDLVLGRLASKVASILRGKHKPTFVPNLDTGDYVVIINADKIRFTGNKELQKKYDQYSGYPGGLKQIPLKRMLEEKPEEIIRHAVKGMLPKNAIGRKMIQKLKVFCGPEHNHGAQKPKVVTL